MKIHQNKFMTNHSPPGTAQNFYTGLPFLNINLLPAFIFCVSLVCRCNILTSFFTTSLSWHSQTLNYAVTAHNMFSSHTWQQDATMSCMDNIFHSAYGGYRSRSPLDILQIHHRNPLTSLLSRLFDRNEHMIRYTVYSKMQYPLIYYSTDMLTHKVHVL